MSEHLITLEALDVDGAIRETAEAAGVDRADFLKRGGIAGAGFVAGGVLFSGFVSPAEAAISTAQPVEDERRQDPQLRADARVPRGRVLQAGRSPTARSRAEPSAAFAEVTGAHEAAHVTALEGAARPRRSRSRRSTSATRSPTQAKFAATAQVLEDTGVAAYAGQGPNILQRPVVKAALSIHSVEARHAAWIRFINSAAADRRRRAATRRRGRSTRPLSEKAVLKAVTATGFIKWLSSARARRARRRSDVLRCSSATRSAISSRGERRACARGRTPRR